MTIIPYEDRYRDDMIFMILEAKNALGCVPHLNDDLLDVKKNYPDAGGMFWLAVEDGRVVGSVGYQSIPGTDEARLHRFFVKYDRKREGIGSALLRTAEEHIHAAGFRSVSVHLGGDPEVWFESYAFYPKHGYVPYAPRYMRKVL